MAQNVFSRMPSALFTIRLLNTSFADQGYVYLVESKALMIERFITVRHGHDASCFLAVDCLNVSYINEIFLEL
ncbi:hypothetical protein T10_5061 [Trichinella papuae]|uniref:Uncharacterized protein n=1 Tax=Trichinella papuae TaxID=268474 RepID=A0A0V1M1D2_9BILA|nr:hypothetical protein T10_5061 [Trichinella papuae]